ncbi:MAG: glycosyltransferase family 2 protein [Planctomycetes bacterium]|nr:glycosyltransferase family 2 protein [Planctomycetota bacterium]
MARRTPFSACIIAFDEERNLPDALASVGFADEIIVVDSHSTDATREVAAAFRGRDLDGREVVPRVIERDWPGHVEQKNFAIDQASHDWVLCIDADERVSSELRREVEAALAADPPGADGYTMPRKTFYLGRWILRSGWYPDRKLRLFRRSRGRWGGTNPHDHVYVRGVVKPFSGDLHHYSYRSMADHIRTINSFTDIAAREKLREGVRWPLLRMLVQPPFKLFKMYVLKQGFREGAAGFIVAVLGALYVFLKYAKLWELRGLAWKDAPVPEGARGEPSQAAP